MRAIAWAALTASVAFLVASCGGGDTSALETQVAALQTAVAATPVTSPDTVVNVERRCERVVDSSVEAEPFEFCNLVWDQILAARATPGGGTIWRYYRVTVRTTEGTTYIIDVPAETSVQ